MDASLDFKRYYNALDRSNPILARGKITKVVGLLTEAWGPVSSVGSICDIEAAAGFPPVKAEVMGFRDDRILLMPLGDLKGIGPGTSVVARHKTAEIGVGCGLLGRVVDALGNPLDGKGHLRVDAHYPVYADPTNPTSRVRIKEPIDTGIRAINGLMSIGCGQRMGIFSGSGVGKSILLGMIARKTAADVNVIALIGERGRELNDFLERDLGEEGLKRSVVIVATSENLPLIRMRGAFVATTVAEYFRDRGMKVLLMMDSLTRFAMAQREIGLAAGEPPTAKGYTPSVFTLLPKLLERAGTGPGPGSITGLYTVLVEGDDMSEPIADAARSILDGHIVLSRDLAMQNHYPPIDVLSSISRVMPDIASENHRRRAGMLKEILATYKKAEDLLNIGAYVHGSNPRIDNAIKMIERINEYLRQEIGETAPYDDCVAALEALFS
jgi:flagellum-specific ATP synthase